ncbi:unnamed protein product [Darwinula stevensoni]|uniref:Peptide-methionine (R)-S-oxide reductase n=1 Tax=Darwinula stevensoni TaxID=69355 RepID=A0A7R9AIW3_9CRUS|nr:unnamed protein product [Darwinula stevensoni]CAG0906045.1 unnamed protein product [Darwinula stevensoni]
MQLLRKGIIAWSIHPGDDNNNDNNDIVPQPTKTSSSTLHESTTSMNKSSTPHKPDLSRWKPLLSEQAYSVMFEHGTERAGSSPLNQEKRDGTYLCAACYSPLFDSSYKYDSGTGWPSFWQSIGGALGFSNDHSLDYPRQEYHCAHCGAHQGHVFPDGPQPSGLRFCDNGVALHFVARDEEMPEVRQP